MATIFQTRHKFYIAGGVFNRANLFTEGASILDFGFTKEKRLAQIRVVFEMQIDSSPNPDWTTVQISPKWSFSGAVLDTEMKQKPSGDAKITNFLIPERCYNEGIVLLSASSEMPCVSPYCMWMGGFQMYDMFLYYPVMYNSSDDYVGRLLITWEFED